MHEHRNGAPVDLAGDWRYRAKRSAMWLGILTLVGSAVFAASRPLVPPIEAPNKVDRSSFGVPEASNGAAPGAQVGQAAPDFVAADGSTPLLVDLEGKQVRVGAFAGHPLWIVFWATWCVPCQEEASGIRAAYHAHREDNLEVLAVDVQEPAAAVRAYALSHALDYTIGVDPSAAVRTLYGGIGLPFHVFIDGHGVIRDRSVGQLTAETMERHLLAILEP